MKRVTNENVGGDDDLGEISLFDYGTIDWI